MEAKGLVLLFFTSLIKLKFMDKKQTLFLGIGFLLATPLANAQNTTDRKLVQGHRTEQLAKKYGEATSLKVRDNAVEKRLTPCLTTGKKHRKAVGNAVHCD